MFVIKGKQLIICSVAVLLTVAGYLNIMYGRGDDAMETVENVGEIHLVEEEKAGDFFEAARMERETSRLDAMETLSTIAENENSESTSKAMAEEEIINLAKVRDTEAMTESIIKSKGYEDVVVFINGDRVNAVVKADEMTEQDATKISEIISTQTGIEASGIKITVSN